MDLAEIIDVIADLGNIVLAINVFLFFISYRKKTVAFKIIACYLLYILVIQLRMSYLNSLKENNLNYVHFYFIGQFLFLSFFFITTFKNKLLSNGIKIYLFTTITSLSIYYYCFPETFYEHNIIEVLLTSIPLIIYSFIFLIKKIDDSNKEFIYLNSGLFIYILCSTLIFIAGKLESDIKNIIWLFNASLYIIYQLLITLEWYKNFKSRKIISDKK